MLIKNPDERPKIEEILRDNWFKVHKCRKLDEK